MDRISSKKRSDVMSSVRSKGTKLENFFAEKLKEKGIDSFTRNVETLVGKPDFINEDAKIIIFIDSCFWHGCKKHIRMPLSNKSYWIAKIARNCKKDRQVTTHYKDYGWLVLRIWEHTLKNPRTIKWWLTKISNLIKSKT